jgi:hypothetical protein
VAAAVFFHFGSKATYKFGASDERFQEVRGNNASMWAGIRQLASRGIRELDFGRTDGANEGLRRFKLSFGATEYPIHYWRYNLRRGWSVTHLSTLYPQPVVPTLNPQPTSGWHNHAFRAMPIWLSRAAGKLLYRHMA